MGPYRVRVDRRVFVPAADGTRLAVTLYLPDAPGDGPFPAVLESLPYRKDDDCTGRDWITFGYLAERGIAGVRLDIRGTGASEGIIEDEYLAQEQADNLEIIRWMAAQEWCTGRIGMWCISWGGFSALQTAMLRPPELGAICAVHATHDRFACDVHYTGGSVHIAESLDWPAAMVPLNALPPDPDIVGDRWYEMWMHRLDHTPQWLPTWLRHQRRDEYWLHGSPCADYGAVTAPTLLIGGWLDPYVDGILAMLEHLDVPRRAVVGPWGHFRPATGVPAPAYDHLDLMARWFAHHLGDEENGVMDEPLLTVFSRTAPPYDGSRVEGEWRAEPAWPPVDATSLDLDLSGLAHDRTTWDGPQWVGSHAPFWDRGGWGSVPGPGARAALVFDTEPFAESVEILGTPHVEATITVDRPVGLVAARLLLVSPEGDGHLICRGSRNLAFPGDLSSPVPIEANRPMRVRFPLRVTSAVIPAGWRLRLAIAGADFPIAWPPGERFTLTIDPEHSRLLLPLVPPRPAGRALTIPEPSPLPPAPVDRLETGSSWTMDRNEGLAQFSRHVVISELQPGRDDLVYDNRQRIEVTVADDDPLSVAAHATAELTLRRPDWEVRTTGSVEITADAAAFHLIIRVTAAHDGVEVWSRDRSDDIPREWA
jgi:predicted acyl esterase